MFNKDFFPTPPEVISQMLTGIDIDGKIILEPSAGRGNIIDYLKANGAENVLACELDRDLSRIVASKCQLISYDFLKVPADKISHIDFIIMNPPFSADEKHILHAWEIAPSGCQIISLCNWETIANDYTRHRKSLRSIIKNNGKRQNLGNVFSTADRKTDVQIGLINLFKPKSDSDDEFEGYFDLEEEFQQQENGLMAHDVVLEIVNRYVGAVKMFDEVEAAARKINQLAEPFKYCGIRFGAHSTSNVHSTITRGIYKKELQKAAWSKVFSMMNMEKYITHRVKEKINKFVEQQQNVPFTRKNIYAMLQMIAGTHKDRMNSVIVEIFDWLTQHHHENRYQKEGWKTNSEYRVNRKFIAPYSRVAMGRHGEPEISWSSTGHHIDDFVKALCVIMGENYDEKITIKEEGRDPYKVRKFQSIQELYRKREVPNILAKEIVKELSMLIPNSESQCAYIHEHCSNLQRIERNLRELAFNWDLSQQTVKTIIDFYSEKNLPSKYFGKCHEYKEFGKWYDFNFFEVKVFKKGTLHAKFKDEKVWERFNQVACKAKGFQLASKYTSDFMRKKSGVDLFSQTA